MRPRKRVLLRDRWDESWDFYALVVAGDDDAAAVCQVVDLVPGGDGTIVHLRMLPGLVEDYAALAERQAG